MITILILRRDQQSARQVLATFEATPDLRVVGIASTLHAARQQIAQFAPEVLITDLSLNDGAAISLLVELRRNAATRERPKAMLLASRESDALLFGSVSAGADSFVIDPVVALLPAAVRRMVRGEAAMTPPLARQVLGFFGTSSKASSGVDERTLDWQHGANDPLQLSRGEQHLLALFGQGESMGGVAARFAISVESVGRRLSNVYRKLQWDVQGGALALDRA